MEQFARRFLREESGADMVEYALVMAIVAIGSIVGFTAVAGALKNGLTSISSNIASNL